jgi:ATP-dependent helicase/nuclease subunit A
METPSTRKCLLRIGFALARGGGAPDTLETLSSLFFEPRIGVGLKFPDQESDDERATIFKILKARKTNAETAERCRLLYVALTRARDQVLITATQEKGNALNILRPGLEHAGVVEELIDASQFIDEKIETNFVQKSEKINCDLLLNPAGPGIHELPVTSLSEYASCQSDISTDSLMAIQVLEKGQA